MVPLSTYFVLMQRQCFSFHPVLCIDTDLERFRKPPFFCVFTWTSLNGLTKTDV